MSDLNLTAPDHGEIPQTASALGKTADLMALRVVPEFTRQRYLRTEVSIQVDGAWLPAWAAVDLLRTPVYVVTAFNPQAGRLGEVENDRRNDQLRAELVEEGFDFRAAIGQSPGGRWVEESWAVTGIGPKRARRLARRWDQDAVFELTDAEQRVLGSDGRWVRTRPLAGQADGVRGPDLAEAVRTSLGVQVEPEFLRAFELGWQHDGDLQLPCPDCGGPLHLFGADLEAKDQTAYRAMAFVCAIEPTVKLPHGVPADYRAAAKAWRSFSLARADADEEGQTGRSHWAYVIELRDDAGDREGRDEPWVYVGQTSSTPEERFAQHLAGYKASKWVRNFGVRLRPDLYRDQPILRTKVEAEAYEAWLATYLSASGYPVKGGH